MWLIILLHLTHLVAHTLADTNERVLIVYGGYSNETEAIFLNSQRTKESCEQLPPVPTPKNPSGVNTNSGLPLVCHGDSFGEFGECYQLSGHPNQWTYHSKTMTGMLSSAYVQVGRSYWMLGGHNTEHDIIASTGYWNPDNMEWRSGPDMPFKAKGQCAAAINDTHLIVAGGWSKDFVIFDKVSIVNTLNSVWSEVDSMSTSRRWHSCGITPSISSGGSQFVVAGGQDKGNLAVDSVEILDLSTMRWTNGPNLPIAMDEATAVLLGDTFILVGGKDVDRNPLDTILEFDYLNEKWIEREEKLMEFRTPAIVSVVDSDFINCS